MSKGADISQINEESFVTSGFDTFDKEQVTIRSMFATVAIIASCTAICFLLRGSFDNINFIMIYLAGVAIVASRYSRRDAVLASILAVGTFDFLFIPPFLTFAVADKQYFLVFAVMLGVALFISSLTLRLRTQIKYSNERERRTAALYKLTKELSISNLQSDVLNAGASEIAKVFYADVCILLPNKNKEVTVKVPSSSQFEKQKSELAVAQWGYTHGERAGKGTSTLPGSKALYLPLSAPTGVIGVLGIQFHAQHIPDINQMNHLETFANAISFAIERTQLANESASARLETQTEKIRNALLSSVSHDLRTPLTVISGTAENIIEQAGESSLLKENAITIKDEADRLNRHLTNLLDMTRLESGINPALEWNSLEELLGVAISATKKILATRKLTLNFDYELPLVKIDAVLIEKVFRNLLENIAKYTPSHAEIEIRGGKTNHSVIIEISDSGPGIESGREEKIFEKFVQQGQSPKGSGFGLGLSICKTIMNLHHGRITAYNQENRGACFRLEFPLSQEEGHQQLFTQ